MPFLPIDQEDLKQQGIEQLDFVLVSGDAYVDHPSFGVAIIARMLERYGFKVGIISQPNLQRMSDFLVLGKPRLAWLVSSGNIDSMVNHYTVAKRRRTKDYYTPGGFMGKRPDRAVIEYSKVLRKLDPSAAIILGGVEASLRRLAHYDYWDDRVRHSILIDSLADLIVYGMGEKAIVEVAEALASGLPIQDLIFIRGTVWKTKKYDYLPSEAITLPSFETIVKDKMAYADSFLSQYENTDAILAKPLVEPYPQLFLVQNPPQEALTREELDVVYSLPYERRVHPKLEKIGHVSAIDEVKFSIVINRGCYGGCSFCALTMHQGRRIQSRSLDSVVQEASQFSKDEDFKGYIHDVGGPTANFYDIACEKQVKHGVCKHRQCLHPSPCKNLQVSHQNYLTILRHLRAIPGVKKVFIRSGVRYDYVMYDSNPEFFQELVEHHVSGQLKVAPEHISKPVLRQMGKPNQELYDRFVKRYYEINHSLKKEQYLVPYLMSSHPGSGLKEAIELAEYVRDLGVNPEQVQDFYPTPGTLSTTMYYTGYNPVLKEFVYVPKTKEEKAMQRALIQYRNPANKELVYQALKQANRLDLVGYGPKCLIRPFTGGKVFDKIQRGKP